jgi:small subunit ribosomal protein S21
MELLAPHCPRMQYPCGTAGIHTRNGLLYKELPHLLKKTSKNFGFPGSSGINSLDIWVIGLLYWCVNRLNVFRSATKRHYFVDTEGGCVGLAGVIVRDNESFESALRRFKKLIEREGRLSEYRRHQHFEKPSERRKRKLLAARRKLLKKMAQRASY